MENQILQGDCLQKLKELPDGIVDCCVTSPPYYGLRDYGVDGQIGLEETPEEYIQKLVDVFREVHRVLKDDGTLWVNIGDSYAAERGGTHKQSGGLKHKDMVGIPWLLAFALRADGWYLRQDIIWNKPNPMPESVTDRCTKSHEYLFLLSKRQKYYFDHEAIQEEAKWKDDRRATGDRIAYDGKRASGSDSHAQQSFVAFSHKKHKNLEYNGQQNHTMHERMAEGLPDEEYVVRNKRDVWTITVKPTKEAHFATFPEDLVEPCILAGSRVGGVVLDPFFGSGTTGRVATKLNRNYIGIELNPEYIEIANRRNSNVQMTLTGLI